jgi:hypothetical protein
MIFKKKDAFGAKGYFQRIIYDGNAKQNACRNQDCWFLYANS